MLNILHFKIIFNYKRFIASPVIIIIIVKIQQNKIKHIFKSEICEIDKEICINYLHYLKVARLSSIGESRKGLLTHESNYSRQRLEYLSLGIVRSMKV